MKNRFEIILFIACLTFLGCQNDDDIINDTPTVDAIAFPEVDSRLQDYFHSFEAEARIRGFEIDLRESSISAAIEEIEAENVAGQCRYGHNTTFNNHIVIDESFLLANVPELLKEMVVFHELGHCFLGRGHREDAYTNGACVSIMRSGIEDCRDAYNTNNRAIYLDELFDPIEFNTIPQ